MSSKSNNDYPSNNTSGKKLVGPMSMSGRHGTLSCESPSSRSASKNSRHVSVMNRVKYKIRENKAVYYMFLVLFLAMHWVDMLSDMYMIQFYWDRDYMTYFGTAATFFILSTILSVFWNFQLFNRSLGLAVLATVLGPVSRNIFVEVMPTGDGPEGWRDSEVEDTEEVKNFTMIFAAMFEDLPQASVNLAFLSRGDSAPVEAVVQVIASIVMGVFKIQHGCSNILCNYEDYEL
mmetsp:Transcript_21976/g.37076  ORF Transcript_21976/g.37076 Transcript_21976/m.37076 type:complete len:233 (-) Transcript_21976:702-1400(-)